EQLGNFNLLHRPVALGDGNVFAGAQRSVEDASDCQAAKIVAVVEIGDQYLQRSISLACRQGNSFHDGVEQRAKILAGTIYVSRGRAHSGVGVENREVQLIFRRIQIDEKVVHLVEHFLRTRVGAINLVDHQDGWQLGLQRLA